MSNSAQPATPDEDSGHEDLFAINDMNGCRRRHAVSWDDPACPPSLLEAVLNALPRHGDLAVVRDGGTWVIGVYPETVLTTSGAGSLDALDRISGGWWAGFISYDLGRSVEHVPSALPDDLGLPDAMWARFDARLIIDGNRLRVEGDGCGRRVLEAVARQAAGGVPSRARFEPLRAWSSSTTQHEFEEAVRAVKALIEAGDCYQLNLTRRLTCPKSVDALPVFAALVQRNPAPHAALLRFRDTSVISASPERFLRREGDRIETRPIKGTAGNPEVLATSRKDHAENVMIVDLARNDLGRICEYGSVTVAGLCQLEPHPGLYHLVSTVQGTLRSNLGLGAILRATFPPASITGAPKPRVMRAIEELETCRRGVYCGAVGWIDAWRNFLDLNVAIRTFVVTSGGTHLGVGAGIVADSDPAAEWRETELKVARLLETVGCRLLEAVPSAGV